VEHALARFAYRLPRYGGLPLALYGFVAVTMLCSCRPQQLAAADLENWRDSPGTRFVSPQGDDDASGSEDSPWCTVQWAVNHLTPGDVLVVENGTYYEHVQLPLVARADQLTVIKAREPGGATIDAGGDGDILADGDAGVENLVIGGLVLKNGRCGIRLEAPVHDLAVTDCEITNCRHALLCDQGESIKLENVSVTGCHDGIGFGVKGKSGVQGLEIVRCRAIKQSEQEGKGNTDGFRVEGMCSEVKVSQCEGAGFDDAGFDIKPDGAIVERCLAHHNWDNGFKLWGRDARLINCIARDNDDTGVSVSDNMGIYNCTIAFNRRAAMRPQPEDIGKLIVRNCIIAYNFVRQYVERGGPGVYDDDYNLYYAEPDELIWKVMDGEKSRYTLADMRDGTLKMGEHSIFADPRFVSVEDRDLRLQPDSPAIGAGLSLDFLTLDFAGQPRGATFDIGAYQRAR